MEFGAAHPLMPLRYPVISALWFAVALHLIGADVFVAPSGKDSNNGTASAPVASLEAAQRLVRPLAGREPVTVHVAPGTYYLAKPLQFSDIDSGRSNAPIEYRADTNGPVVISGGTPLLLHWKPYQKGIVQAEVPSGIEIDQLWINGQRQWMARFPNRVPGHDFNVFDTWKLEGDNHPDPAMDPLQPSRIARWKDPVGGFLHALHPALWGGVHWRITGQKPDGSLALEGGTQNNRGSGIHPLFRMVENIFEELDSPGEWFYNRSSHQLFYYPPAELRLDQATVEVVRLRELISLRGTLATPVRFLRFTGFTFRHTARTFMETKEPLLRSDWTTYRGGAVFMTGTEDCQIDDCYFDQVGGNTIFVSGYNRRVAIRGCRIEDSGANGVAFVGEVQSVRSPLLNYDQAFDYAKLDRTPGPSTEDYPADCLVDDCLISHTGRVEKQTAGIEIAMARRITVRRCSIYDVPRAGINLGDGCWGGHLIEDCDIFNTVLETGDHGCWNSWGRDRYWHPDPSVINREVAADPGLTNLDTLEPITLRHNRWRCDHGWDVDLDDGSSHYRIYNNLFLNGGLKLREGYDRRVWNNIAVHNSLHPHVWLKNSGDMVVQNIWMGAYQPAVMPEGTNRWGRVVDHNLFATTESDRQKFLEHDCDGHSVVGDPRFLNPGLGDFRVAPDSPALNLGFKNFPMDTFGVQKASLRAIAKTPTFPPVRETAKKPAVNSKPPVPSAWGGMTIRSLEGSEFSAYGVGQSSGGIVLVKVPDSSAGAKAGFHSGDVIQQIGGKEVHTTSDLFRLLATRAESGGSMPIRLIRRQATVELKVPTDFGAPH